MVQDCNTCNICCQLGEVMLSKPMSLLCMAGLSHLHGVQSKSHHIISSITCELFPELLLGGGDFSKSLIELLCQFSVACFLEGARRGGHCLIKAVPNGANLTNSGVQTIYKILICYTLFCN